MKCIKMNKDGQIMKVTDAQADHLVSSLKAQYVPRHIWRESKKPTTEPNTKPQENVAQLKNKKT